MHPTWLDDHGLLLSDRSPLPLDVPFTAAQAEIWGVGRTRLRRLVEGGLVRRVLHGVYAAAQAPDDPHLRALAIALVLPDGAVVTDRTAAWLHGVDLLPRSALTVPPPLSVFHTGESRLKRGGVDGGRRGLDRRDVTVVHGVRVTTALRTCLDLGRLLWRYDALAAIDGFLRIGVPHELLLAEIGRFRGYRGVRQLRALAVIGDARSESVGESALRLHWYDAGLPPPQLQWWVLDDDGVERYRLDLAEPELRYAAEYDGQDFHTAAVDRAHDTHRRTWLHDERAWLLDVFDRDDVYSRQGDPIARLQAGIVEARRRCALWTPRRRA
jgi:hypothetical protein